MNKALNVLMITVFIESLIGCKAPDPSSNSNVSTGSSQTSSSSMMLTQAATSTTDTTTMSTSPSPSPSPSPTQTPTYAYSVGKGTQAEPYEIFTSDDFINISQYPSAYFTVEQNIDLNGYTITPIQNFSGTIYGNNYYISNIYIQTTGTDNAALFINFSGTIVSMQLQDITVTSQAYSAAFAYNLTGLISSCGVHGTITSPMGGNGYNTGTGNPVYTKEGTGGSVLNTSQSVTFNNNTVNNTINQ